MNQEINLQQVVELAWAAGLFDGEGSFSVTKTKDSYSIRANLEMTSLETIEDFNSIVKIGYIRSRKGRGEHRKNTHTWYCQASEAADVARKLLPYLKLKKPQAEKVIEFNDKWQRRHRVDDPLDYEIMLTLNMICDEMRELNHRGSHGPATT